MEPRRGESWPKMWYVYFRYSATSCSHDEVVALLIPFAIKRLPVMQSMRMFLLILLLTAGINTATFAQPGDPIVVTNCAELDQIRSNPGSSYVLGNDIDCAATTTWNAGAGWEPIGTVAAPFTGTLDGNGHVISALYINRGASDNIGLFGVTGPGSAISNLGVVAVSIAGDDIVGAIAGNNGGTITDSYSTGTFTSTYSEAGGLVGHNNGVIHDCSSEISVSVPSGDEGGGLAGINYGTITHSHATGAVSGYYGYLGGLVGRNWATGSISDSYATGNVGSTNDYVGGFVGENNGTIAECYATGSVSGDDTIGGFVGRNDNGPIRDSYATGNVSGASGYVGGFVGANENDAPVDNSYSVGLVTGSAPAGGFAGYIWGTPITDSFYDSETSGQSDTGQGEPRTTAQMKDITTFTPPNAGWDFEATWGIDLAQNNGYPYLLWLYNVGGTVSGLAPGNSVVLQNNLGDDLTVTADGDFVFSTPLADGSGYAVTLATQPPDQFCTVTNGTGTISGLDVTDVAVTCFAIVDLTMAVLPDGAGTTIPAVGTTGVHATVPQDISATASGGYNFVNWSVSGSAVVADSEAPSTSVTLTGNATVTANFCSVQTWYPDADGDGYGDPAGAPRNQCDQPAGYAIDNTDCNDANAAINPGATEVCDGVDNNCDGQIDEGVKLTWFLDSDEDGYGDPGSSVQECSQPSGYVSGSTDCNDSDALEHPNQTWYKDEDGDGYSGGTTMISCLRPGNYYAASELVQTSGDQDDTDPKIFPGKFPWPMFLPAITSAPQP